MFDLLKADLKIGYRNVATVAQKGIVGLEDRLDEKKKVRENTLTLREIKQLAKKSVRVIIDNNFSEEKKNYSQIYLMAVERKNTAFLVNTMNERTNKETQEIRKEDITLIKRINNGEINLITSKLIETIFHVTLEELVSNISIDLLTKEAKTEGETKKENKEKAKNVKKTVLKVVKDTTVTVTKSSEELVNDSVVYDNNTDDVITVSSVSNEEVQKIQEEVKDKQEEKIIEVEPVKEVPEVEIQEVEVREEVKEKASTKSGYHFINPVLATSILRERFNLTDEMIDRLLTFDHLSFTTDKMINTFTLIDDNTISVGAKNVKSSRTSYKIYILDKKRIVKEFSSNKAYKKFVREEGIK